MVVNATLNKAHAIGLLLFAALGFLILTGPCRAPAALYHGDDALSIAGHYFPAKARTHDCTNLLNKGSYLTYVDGWHVARPAILF